MTIVCVGDCGIDRYVNLGVDRPGGIALNFAVNARRLFGAGDRIVVVTTLGNDPEGRAVADVFPRFNLDAVIAWRKGSTPVQSIERLESGERRFAGYAEGVLGGYRLDDTERAIVRDADLLVGAAFRQAEALFESVMASPSRGLRAVDFSDLSDFEASPDVVERWISFFQVGFFGLSEEDADLVDALHRLAIKHDRLFVVTLGHAGSLALTPSDRYESPALPVPAVVDTTGAGDTFAAGFLAEYCRSRDVQAALAAGNREAAASIQQLGAFSYR
jgi:sugar/nucleoside kinase (ribokinase family)